VSHTAGDVSYTCSSDIADIISKRRQALFGHVVRLGATTPAHQALCQLIAMKGGQSLWLNCQKLPGRPRKTWIQQIGNETPASWRQMWQSADERGRRGKSPQRTSAVYTSCWWWWWWQMNLVHLNPIHQAGRPLLGLSTQERCQNWVDLDVGSTVCQDGLSVYR